MKLKALDISPENLHDNEIAEILYSQWLVSRNGDIYLDPADIPGLDSLLPDETRPITSLKTVPNISKCWDKEGFWADFGYKNQLRVA